MKTETKIVLFAAVFVAVIAAIYWFTSYEDAGATMLAAGAIAYTMMCAYLYLQVRRLRSAPRPEDVEDAPISAGDVGFFPAASVWPAALGLGAVVTGLGLVFGYWFFAIAAVLVVGAIIGYATEAQVPH